MERASGLPGPDQLPAQKELPDPLLTKSGKRVKTRTEWIRRREEIKRLLAVYQYGRMPPPPKNLSAKELSRETVFGGKATKQMLRLTMGPDRRISLYFGLIVPSGRGPFPVIVNIDHREAFALPNAEEIIGRGYILAGYDPTHLDPDQRGTVGPAQAAYPDHDWGTLAVWAWGAMRIVDHLLTQEMVDRDRIAVAGHSRSGKTALLAGALDERFSLVVPQCSGTGGAAAYRFRRPPASETLAEITRNFDYWFVPRLKSFVGREERLPFDQHFLLALVAPRALLISDARGDAWANPYGTRRAYEGARVVFKLLGAADKIRLHVRPGSHDLIAEDFRTLLDFGDRIWSGTD